MSVAGSDGSDRSQQAAPGPTRAGIDQRFPHALSLKVLRASRPHLGVSPDLYHDRTSASSSGFTLTPLLALPTAFGNINLGETFSGIVIASNESRDVAYNATMRVEMQTATARIKLWESLLPDADKAVPLAPGQAIEAPLLEHEIREPGLHALVCSVSYWASGPQSYMDIANKPELVHRSFRKLFKFQVTNPLSVKTKVHASRNIAAALDETMQCTSFLEVQVQNLAPEPLLFESLIFHPNPGLEVQDLTVKPTSPIQSGDIVQCLFIVAPTKEQHPEVYQRAVRGGGVMHLGKLDVRWRGRMGEPGHLSTSQLIRRLPLPIPVRLVAETAEISLRPPLLPAVTSEAMTYRNSQNSDTSYTSTRSLAKDSLRFPGRPPSPMSASSRPSSPTHPQASRFALHNTDLYATLFVKPPSSTSVPLGDAFTIDFELKISSTVRSSRFRQRRLKLAAQHVNYHDEQWRTTKDTGDENISAADASSASYSMQQSLQPERTIPEIALEGDSQPARVPTSGYLPPPVPLDNSNPFRRPDLTVIDENATLPSSRISFLGSSLVELAPITLRHLPQATEASDLSSISSRRQSVESAKTDEQSLAEIIDRKGRPDTAEIRAHFSLTYLPLQYGIHAVGGVRILLLEDIWIGTDATTATEISGLPPCNIVEHTIIAEVLVE